MLAQAPDGVMGEHDLRQVNPFPLASELQQRQQALVEDRPLFDSRIAVVEHLREERVEADECPDVSLEQNQRIQLVLGSLCPRVVSRRAG